MNKCFKDFYFIGLSLGLWIKIALKITEVVLNCVEYIFYFIGIAQNSILIA